MMGKKDRRREGGGFIKRGVMGGEVDLDGHIA
jgi:hypothetical protein